MDEQLKNTPISLWELPDKQKGDLAAFTEMVRENIKSLYEVELERENPRVQDWFYEKHLQVVKDRVDWVLENCSFANPTNNDSLYEDIALYAELAVWGHDYGRIIGSRNRKGDFHNVVSAFAFADLMDRNGFSPDQISLVANSLLRHRSKDNSGLPNVSGQPISVLDKIISSADALAHFDGAFLTIDQFIEHEGFWFHVWRDKIQRGSNINEIMQASKSKMKRDKDSKQCFEASTERAKKEYEWFMENMEDILTAMFGLYENL